MSVSFWHPRRGQLEPRNHKNFFDLAYNKGKKPIYVWVSYPISNSIFRYKVAKGKPDGDWFVKASDKYWVEDDRSEPGFSWLKSQTAEERRMSDAEAYLEIARKYGEHDAVFR